jgi:hypothetical protein
MTGKNCSCKKFASGGRIGRAKATTIKAGVTKNRSRKYCGGGKLK